MLGQIIVWITFCVSLIRCQSLNPSILTLNAEEIDFIDGNITARAPYPDLNIKIRRNGQFVDTALNVQPGTPLEMIIYLDEESRHVYGLLISFLKVMANTQNNSTQEEVIILNGCSIDPYIFGNFETLDGGDSLSAKFRAFKFPESNFVKFVGTVNVCLNQCQGVPCGNGQWGFGRKRRSIPDQIPSDPNKVMELEWTTVLKVDNGPDHLHYINIKKESMESRFDSKTESKVQLKANQTKANQVKRQAFLQNTEAFSSAPNKQLLIPSINAIILSILFCSLLV